MTSTALEASEKLAEEGIKARVINMGTIKPIDEEAIVKAAKETKAIVTAEEHSVIGGLGSAVADVLAQKACAPLVKVGIDDVFGESGKPDELLKKYGIDTQAVVDAAKEAVKKK